MNLTWKKCEEGEVQTPYQKSTSQYSVYYTDILGENFPIYILQSETTRRLLIQKDGKSARLHLGMARAKDLCSATYEIASTSFFGDSFATEHCPEYNAISAMLIREPVAQSPFINTYLASGFESRLYAIMDVHHVEDKDGLKGLSGKVCNYRIDIPEEKSGEIHSDISLAFLYDSIAGGRNLKAAIEDLRNRFKNLDQVIVVSVYITLEGSRRITEFCEELGLRCSFFGMHELLTASPINEYDCFYPEWNINKDDEKLMKEMYGEKYREMQMGGDWTANSLGIEQAQSVLDMQLEEKGINL